MHNTRVSFQILSPKITKLWRWREEGGDALEALRSILELNLSLEWSTKLRE